MHAYIIVVWFYFSSGQMPMHPVIWFKWSQSDADAAIATIGDQGAYKEFDLTIGSNPEVSLVKESGQ